jgi:hypothetical protein
MPLPGFGDAAGECLTGEEYGPFPADEPGRLKLPPYDRLCAARDELSQDPFAGCVGGWNGGGEEVGNPLPVKERPA